jgi:gamma-glutamylcyclotransferase
MAPHLHYFAYGSNMLSTRLIARAPSARAAGLGSVAGMSLQFHKTSTDGSGKCDMVIGQSGDSVVGVIFLLDERELSKLDVAEGIGHGYERSSISVLTNGTLVDCLTYVATKTDPSLLPYDWYWRLVLAGLLEHGAPAEYLGRVRAVQTQPDPKLTRPSRIAGIAAIEEFRRANPLLAAALNGEDDA